MNVFLLCPWGHEEAIQVLKILKIILKKYLTVTFFLFLYILCKG